MPPTTTIKNDFATTDIPVELFMFTFMTSHNKNLTYLSKSRSKRQEFNKKICSILMFVLEKTASLLLIVLNSLEFNCSRQRYCKSLESTP